MLGIVAAGRNRCADARTGRRASSETPEDRGWQAVAPGRVEPWSGEIRSPRRSWAGSAKCWSASRQGVRRRAVDPSRRQRGPGADCHRRGTDRVAQARPQRPVHVEPGGPNGRRAEDWVADAEHGVFDAQFGGGPGGDREAGGAGVGGRLTAARRRCRASRTGSSSASPSCAPWRMTRTRRCRPERRPAQRGARRASPGAGRHR